MSPLNNHFLMHIRGVKLGIVNLVINVTSLMYDPLKLIFRPKACNTPHTCELKHVDADGSETLRYMTTCNPCPNTYPWI